MCQHEGMRKDTHISQDKHTRNHIECASSSQRLRGSLNDVILTREKQTADYITSWW